MNRLLVILVVQLSEDLGLNQDRIDRYLEKIEKIRKRSKNIEEWLKHGIDETSKNTERRLAIYKAFQEVVEAITDVCAMFAADNKMSVGDDYENLDKASGKLYREDIKGDLEDANGLRNRIFHEYNKFEDRRALESIIEGQNSLKKFLEDAERWIENQ